MTRKKSLFIILKENINQKVRFGENNHVNIINKGSITLKENIDNIMHMHNTLYVLEFKHNILNIIQLCIKKTTCSFPRKRVVP